MADKIAYQKIGVAAENFADARRLTGCAGKHHLFAQIKLFSDPENNVAHSRLKIFGFLQLLKSDL